MKKGTSKAKIEKNEKSTLFSSFAIFQRLNPEKSSIPLKALFNKEVDFHHCNTGKILEEVPFKLKIPSSKFM